MKLFSWIRKAAAAAMVPEGEEEEKKELAKKLEQVQRQRKRCQALWLRAPLPF